MYNIVRTYNPKEVPISKSKLKVLAKKKAIQHERDLRRKQYLNGEK